jgi:hypothetical protein
MKAPGVVVGPVGPVRSHPRSHAVRASRHMGKAANLFFCSRGWSSGIAHLEANWVGMGGGWVGGEAQGVWGRKGGPPLPNPTPRPGRCVGVGVLTGEVMAEIVHWLRPVASSKAK